jgi:hypothetical protein
MTLIRPKDYSTPNTLIDLLSLKQIPNLIKKGIAGVLGSYRTLTSLYSSKDIEQLIGIIPSIGLKNDYTSIVNENGAKIPFSKKISVLSFLRGQYINLYSTIAYPVYRDVSTSNYKKYIINSQDVISKDGKFLIKEILNIHDISVSVVDHHHVYINEIIFEECSFQTIKEAMDIIVTLQQIIQHGGLHILSSCGYDLMKRNNISSDSLIIQTILEYGKDIRDVTEGFALRRTFSFNETAFINLPNEKIMMLLNFVPNFNGALLLDWNDTNLLQVPITRSAYKVFQSVCRKHISSNDIIQLTTKLKDELKDELQAFNFLCNMMFTTSFYHCYTHDIISDCNRDYYVTTALLNQLNYGITSQPQNQNPFLTELKNSINEISNGKLGKWVTNLHTING